MAALDCASYVRSTPIDCRRDFGFFSGRNSAFTPYFNQSTPGVAARKIIKSIEEKNENIKNEPKQIESKPNNASKHNTSKQGKEEEDYTSFFLYTDTKPIDTAKDSTSVTDETNLTCEGFAGKLEELKSDEDKSVFLCKFAQQIGDYEANFHILLKSFETDFQRLSVINCLLNKFDKKYPTLESTIDTLNCFDTDGFKEIVIDLIMERNVNSFSCKDIVQFCKSVFVHDEHRVRFLHNYEDRLDEAKNIDSLKPMCDFKEYHCKI